MSTDESEARDERPAIGVAPMHVWASERLSAEVRRSLDRLARADDVRHVAVMPDVHASGDICVGTAFATTQLVYPDAVGGDIGCGMAAVALGAVLERPRDRECEQLARTLRDAVPIQRQRTDAAQRLEAAVPPPEELSAPVLQQLARDEGPHQLGTLGRGNHFFEVQREPDGQLWLMVHSGSRGMGQAIRAHHMDSVARGATGLRSLDLGTEAGCNYMQDMDWARQFARASRRAMLDSAASAVEQLCGWPLVAASYIDCDHNHVSIEQLLGQQLLIHRKGAVPAARGQLALVPGSMAAPSYHVSGRGVEASLCSSAHGAGRAMSRSDARSRVTRDRLARELHGVYVDPRALGGLREEAPSAYKDIRGVMKSQRELVGVVRTVMPILTHKGVERR